MKLGFFVYRLAAVLTAFMLGVGFFTAGQYLQTFFRTAETAAQVQPVAKREPLFVPPWTAPSPLFTPKPYVAPEPIADDAKETKPEFSPDGYYYVIGDLPPGFKDFKWFELTTRNYQNDAKENNHEGVPIPPEGFFSTNKPFNFVKISISDKWLAFETEAIDGISYKFVGEFPDEPEKISLEYDDGSGAYTDEAILKGRLVKMRNGKKIIEREVKFGFTIGC